jgi:hypothetical protein
MPPWNKLPAYQQAVISLAVSTVIAANHYALELASRVSGWS